MNNPNLLIKKKTHGGYKLEIVEPKHYLGTNDLIRDLSFNEGVEFLNKLIANVGVTNGISNIVVVNKVTQESVQTKHCKKEITEAKVLAIEIGLNPDDAVFFSTNNLEPVERCLEYLLELAA